MNQHRIATTVYILSQVYDCFGEHTYVIGVFWTRAAAEAFAANNGHTLAPDPDPDYLEDAIGKCIITSEQIREETA